MTLLELAVTTEQKVALRTHIEKILSFVRVVALLYQQNRWRVTIGEERYVIAGLDDFRLALDVLQPTIKSTITRLGKRQEEALQLFDAGSPLNKHDVAKALGVSEDTAYRTLKALYKNGYLKEDRSGGKGEAYAYHLLNKPKAFGIPENRASAAALYEKELTNLLERISAMRTQGVTVSIARPHIADMPINLPRRLLHHDTPRLRIPEAASKAEDRAVDETKPDHPRSFDIPNENQPFSPFFHSAEKRKEIHIGGAIPPRKTPKPPRLSQHLQDALARVCWICHKPLPTDLFDCTTAEGRPCHIACYTKFKQGRKEPPTY
jgi:DNA-binding transcriptional ArsR family regulator